MRTAIHLANGRCSAPGCGKTAGETLFCTACWWDLTPDERLAIKAGFESPYSREPDTWIMEIRLAIVAAAQALHRRRRLKDARRFLNGRKTRLQRVARGR